MGRFDARRLARKKAEASQSISALGGTGMGGWVVHRWCGGDTEFIDHLVRPFTSSHSACVNEATPFELGDFAHEPIH
jgi:hypothetical protein